MSRSAKTVRIITRIQHERYRMPISLVLVDVYDGFRH